MAIVRDLSGNGYEYAETHIPSPGTGAIEVTGLATEVTLGQILEAMPTGYALEATQDLARIAAQSSATSLNSIATATAPVVVQSGPPVAVAASITSGTSLSAAVQVDGRVVGIVTPTAWTTADITFQWSPDNSTFYDLMDDGVERKILSANIPTGAARGFPLDLGDWLIGKYIKVRSGISGAGVNQGATRAITIITAG